MKFINGTNRNQLPLFTSSIDDAIAQDNQVRLIDLFVDSLTLSDYGFAFDFVENGRPSYHPSDLLKLFIYGYLNRMRSSRTLEKECSRNIELMWLLKGLVPDHNTIANFRKDNPKATNTAPQMQQGVTPLPPYVPLKESEKRDAIRNNSPFFRFERQKQPPQSQAPVINQSVAIEVRTDDPKLAATTIAVLSLFFFPACAQSTAISIVQSTFL